MNFDEYQYLISLLAKKELKVSTCKKILSRSSEQTNAFIKDLKKYIRSHYGDDDSIMKNSEFFAKYKFELKIITLLRLRNSSGKIFDINDPDLTVFDDDFTLALIGYQPARYEGFNYKLFAISRKVLELESMSKDIKDYCEDLSIYVIPSSGIIDYEHLFLVKSVQISCF